MSLTGIILEEDMAGEQDSLGMSRFEREEVSESCDTQGTGIMLVSNTRNQFSCTNTSLLRRLQESRLLKGCMSPKCSKLLHVFL